MNNGGYDLGYKKCNCFWGTNPGSLIIKLEEFIDSFQNKTVLDIGCGEGKNALYLAKKGCKVDAFDISENAIQNANILCLDNKNINLAVNDVTKINLVPNKYDIIIAYGLFHCLGSSEIIENLINNCLNALKEGGYFIVCTFNNRKQDLSAHKDFNPLLLPHSYYLNIFKDSKILFQSDEVLYETHPHNNIPHSHSMTRLILKK